MAITEKAVTDVEVNGQKAAQVLDQLKAKADGYKKAMVEANKANNLDAFKKAESDLKATEKSMAQLRKTAFDTDRVLSNLSRSSLTDLNRAQTQIKNSMRGLTRGTEEYVRKSSQLKLVSREISKVKQEMYGAAGAQQGWLSRANGFFSKWGGWLVGGAAAVTGLSFGLRKLSDDAMEFQSRLANLSALTGLEGESLDWLGIKAKELSTSVTADGVRITQSAEDIVDAFTLMGSKKPELLTNKEALAQVTTEALKLAEAAKMDTKTAVESLANVMNQFNAGAEESSRYINVLAAGSKNGAAAVDKISTSIVKFGPAAASANISVEESVALIETLAEKGVEGEIAGTQLRTALLRLQTGADQFNPKVVGLNRALLNLNKANLSAGDLVKMFGQEAYTAGAILVSNTDRVEHYTKAVTNTNVAVEQAIKNTSTDKAMLEQRRNELKLTAMELGQKLTPALAVSTSWLNKMVKVLTVLIPWLKDNGKYLAIATVAISSYVVALKLKAAWLWITEKATKAATMAMNLFNNASKVNWLAVIVSLLATAAASFAFFRTKTKEATAAQNEFNDAVARGNEILGKNKTIEERVSVLKTLSKRQLEILKDDISNQLKAEEDYKTQLLSILKKRFDEDASLRQLRKSFDKAETDQQKAFIANRISIREKEIAADLEAENKKHNKSVIQLKNYLSRVDEAYKNAPNETGGGGAVDFKALESDLERATQLKRIALLRQYADEKMTREQLNAEIWSLEYSHLLSLLALRESAGDDTIDLQQKIAEKQVEITDSLAKANADIINKMVADATKAANDVDSAFVKSVDDAWAEVDRIFAEEEQRSEEQERRNNERIEEMKKEAEEYKAIGDSTASTFGALIGDFATSSSMTQQEFNKNMILMMLDALHAVVRMSIAKIWAQSLASAESIYTWGAAGVAKAGIISVLVEAAFAGVKAVVSNSMQSRTKQYASGKYDVVGADDGRSYSAPYIGTPQTGVVWNPAIISEQGPEIIIDAKRSANIRMRYPQLMDAIKSVPQHAAGTVPAGGGSFNTAMLESMLAQNAAVIGALATQLNKGIKAKVGYTDIKDAEVKVNTILTKASRKG